MENENITASSEPKITQTAVYHLKGATIWMKIIAIVNFLFALFFIYLQTQQFDAKGVGIIVIIIALNSILFGASNAIGTYGNSNAADDIEKAASKLKSYFILSAVSSILLLLGSFYVYFAILSVYGGGRMF